MNYRNICHGCMEEKGDLQTCPKCGWVEGTEPESPIFLKPGTILQGKYLIGKVLGHGGFGITYLAFDINLGFKLAIKEYLPQGMATRNLGDTQVSVYSGNVREQFEYGLEKFLDEARTIARFEEVPEIVKIKDFFKDNGTAYIAMNYIEGITLKEYIANNGGRLPLDAVLNIMLPVMKALEQVHNAGILHRDISPDNIYITKNFQVRLLDFGAARFAIGENSKSLSVVLKPGYAPEEQYRSRGKQGPWTDVYAVAATMYKALTGETPPESLDRLETDSIILPEELNVEIPKSMEAALMKALKVKAADRYQSISEFTDALLRQQESVNSQEIKPSNSDQEKTAEVKYTSVDETVNINAAVVQQKTEKEDLYPQERADRKLPDNARNHMPKKKNGRMIAGFILGAAFIIGLSVLCVILLNNGTGGSSAGRDAEPEKKKTIISDIMKNKNISGSIVVGLSYSDYGMKDKFDLIANDFMREFPDTQVSFERIAENDNDLDIKLEIKLASGELNDISIIPKNLKNEQFSNELLPLDDLGYSKGDLFTYDSGAYNGTLYTISPSAGFTGIRYNKTAFSKAGITDIPKTTSDFYNACDKLKAAGITPVVTGYAEGWPLYVWAEIYPYERTGDPNLRARQLNSGTYFNGPMLGGFNFISSLKNKGYIEQDPSKATYNGMTDSLKSGEAGMAYSGAWLASDSPDIGMFPVPDAKAVCVMGGNSFGIPKYSRAPIAAKAFLKYLMDDDRYCKILSINTPSFKNSSMQSPSLKELLSYGLPVVDATVDDRIAVDALKKAELNDYDVMKDYLSAEYPQTVLDSANKKIADSK